MELQQVKYFLAICETRNFTRAAERCHVTQPALTKSIQRLERELGGQVFHRERNLTRLTELGKLILPYLEQSHAAAESAKQKASGFRRNESPLIRLGLARCISSGLVVSAMAKVAAKMPTVDIILQENTTERLVEALMQSEIDVAVLVDSIELSERLNRWPLCQENYCLVMHARHPLAALDVVPLSGLAAETLLDGPSTAVTRWVAEKCAAEGLRIHYRHRASTDEHLQQMAAAMMGVGFIPENQPVLAGLEKRRLAIEPPSRSILLASVSGRVYSSAVSAFISLCRASKFEPIAAELGLLYDEATAFGYCDAVTLKSVSALG